MVETHDALVQGFNVAVQNSVRHVRRSLLDFVDLQIALQQDKADPKFWEVFKKRIHNDLSMLGHQMTAATEILKTGGDIPPFGRTDEQIQSDTQRKAQRTYLKGNGVL